MTRAYKFFYRSARFLWRLLFRVKIVYEAPGIDIPEAPCIICSNHIHLVDFFSAGICFKKQLLFFAKAELFEQPVIKNIIPQFAIPIKRGFPDIVGLKSAIERVSAGEFLCLFPQGTRCNGIEPALTQVKEGVGLIAYKAKASVLPIHIQSKNYCVKLFRKMTIYVGKPIPFEELGFTSGKYKEYQQASDNIFARICSLPNLLSEK